VTLQARIKADMGAFVAQSAAKLTQGQQQQQQQSRQVRTWLSLRDFMHACCFSS